jgi:hypothetical protein
MQNRRDILRWIKRHEPPNSVRSGAADNVADRVEHSADAPRRISAIEAAPGNAASPRMRSNERYQAGAIAGLASGGSRRSGAANEAGRVVATAERKKAVALQAFSIVRLPALAKI